MKSVLYLVILFVSLTLQANNSILSRFENGYDFQERFCLSGYGQSMCHVITSPNDYECQYNGNRETCFRNRNVVCFTGARSFEAVKADLPSAFRGGGATEVRLPLNYRSENSPRNVAFSDSNSIAGMQIYFNRDRGIDLVTSNIYGQPNPPKNFSKICVNKKTKRFQFYQDFLFCDREIIRNVSLVNRCDGEAKACRDACYGENSSAWDWFQSLNFLSSASADPIARIEICKERKCYNAQTSCIQCSIEGEYSDRGTLKVKSGPIIGLNNLVMVANNAQSRIHSTDIGSGYEEDRPTLLCRCSGSTPTPCFGRGGTCRCVRSHQECVGPSGFSQ